MMEAGDGRRPSRYRKGARYHMGLFGKLAQGALGNMNELSPEELAREYGAYLMEGETIQLGYRLVRDVVLFTDKRIVDFDKQGNTGVKMRVSSIYLSSVIRVSAETAGFGLDDSAIDIAYIPTFARTVRASVLTVKDQEFIEAARSIGCNDREIIFKYIVPNAMAPIIVQATLGLAGAILSIAGLSFLGLGIQPPTPEWGAMLSNARVYMRDAWHVTVIPGLGIMLTILSLNLMGDGLRDALDPRLKN